MTLLEQIISTKKKEIYKEREYISINTLENSLFFKRKSNFLSQKLKESTTGIIAEFKRKSPLKGIINNTVSVQEVAADYEKAGAIGISILTDRTYFNGSNQDLVKTRNTVSLPILRKDFIIDEYQVLSAKSLGADIILLIAAILSKQKLKDLSCLAQGIGLEVLMEIHSEKELDKFNDHLNLIGINNRDLKTFSVDIERSVNLANILPKHLPKISESGINDPAKIRFLQKLGFQGFLIGEHFMHSNHPGKNCETFIKKISLH